MHWIARSLAASFSGSALHSLLMAAKAWFDWLPGFQPYERLQAVLGGLVGAPVHPLVPWALSFVSGATLIGLVFGAVYRRLPGRSGAVKGLSFGLVAWAAMGLALFPLLGFGLFAAGTSSGLAPVAFSLAMLLTYSVGMGLVYSALER